ALDRGCAHVADREDAAARCRERMASGARRCTGENEALCIERDLRTREPIGIRISTDKQEQMIDRAPHFLAGGARAPAHRAQHAIMAFKTAHSGAAYNLRIRQPPEAVHAIT